MAAVAQITAPITFSGGTTAVAADVNTNFTNFRSAFNNLVTGANAIAVDVIAENTGAAGVTIDGVLLKDNGITLSGTLAGAVGTFSSTLGVTGLLTATAGITSGSNIVSDTDSTDDLGATGTRWANLWVDAITMGGALTASGGGSLTGTWTDLGIVTTVDINGGTIGGVTLDGTISGTPTWASTQAMSVSGNAATATALANPRTIGGTSFDGTANIAVNLAATATILATGRNINGVSFNGSANITVTAAAGTLTGTTLKSTVVSSSLTSLGILADIFLESGAVINFNSADMAITHAADQLTVSGGTFITTASGSPRAGFRLAPGSAPSSPVNGDIWVTSAGLFARINGTTVGPYIESV